MINLPLTSIVRNEDQPRTRFDDVRLAELVESVRTSGIIQPIAVRSRGGQFEIVAGERRWLAAQAAGLDSIPAIVHGVDDRDALILALAENVVRDDLGAIELARAYAALIDRHGVSVSDLARALGRSRPAVANTLRLLELPEDVIELVANGELGEGHARAILSIADRTAQRRAARMAVATNMSVRQVEAHAKRVAQGPAGRTIQPRSESILSEEICAALEQLLPGTKVSAKSGRGGPRLELRFASTDALVAGAVELSDRLGNRPRTISAA
jgi:ParB family chromosome partitioning protein